MNAVDFLRTIGYPKKILGNDGYTAVLVGIQPLVDGDFEAIYRYPGGECVHDLETVQKFFEVVEK